MPTVQQVQTYLRKEFGIKNWQDLRRAASRKKNKVNISIFVTPLPLKSGGIK